jgi:hypothetical protein
LRPRRRSPATAAPAGSDTMPGTVLGSNSGGGLVLPAPHASQFEARPRQFMPRTRVAMVRTSFPDHRRRNALRDYFFTRSFSRAENGEALGQHPRLALSLKRLSDQSEIANFRVKSTRFTSCRRTPPLRIPCFRGQTGGRATEYQGDLTGALPGSRCFGWLPTQESGRVSRHPSSRRSPRARSTARRSARTAAPSFGCITLAVRATRIILSAAGGHDEVDAATSPTPGARPGPPLPYPEFGKAERHKVLGHGGYGTRPLPAL